MQLWRHFMLSLLAMVSVCACAPDNYMASGALCREFAMERMLFKINTPAFLGKNGEITYTEIRGRFYQWHFMDFIYPISISKIAVWKKPVASNFRISTISEISPTTGKRLQNFDIGKLEAYEAAEGDIVFKSSSNGRIYRCSTEKPARKIDTCSFDAYPQAEGHLATVTVSGRALKKLDPVELLSLRLIDSIARPCRRLAK